MAVLCALGVVAVMLAARCFVPQAHAREPLPDLSRELVALERCLPVLLSAERTANATTVALVHTGRALP